MAQDLQATPLYPRVKALEQGVSAVGASVDAKLAAQDTAHKAYVDQKVNSVGIGSSNTAISANSARISANSAKIAANSVEIVNLGIRVDELLATDLEALQLAIQQERDERIDWDADHLADANPHTQYARLAIDETVTGNWTHTDRLDVFVAGTPFRTQQISAANHTSLIAALIQNKTTQASLANGMGVKIWASILKSDDTGESLGSMEWVRESAGRGQWKLNAFTSVGVENTFIRAGPAALTSGGTGVEFDQDVAVGGLAGRNLRVYGTIYADTITERVTNSGVTIETVTIKDGLVDGVDMANVVTGPGSAVDDRIVTFNGTTGKVIQDSGVALSDLAISSHTHVAADITDFDVAVGLTTSYADHSADINDLQIADIAFDGRIDTLEDTAFTRVSPGVISTAEEVYFTYPACTIYGETATILRTDAEFRVNDKIWISSDCSIYKDSAAVMKTDESFEFERVAMGTAIDTGSTLKVDYIGSNKGLWVRGGNNYAIEAHRNTYGSTTGSHGTIRMYADVDTSTYGAVSDDFGTAMYMGHDDNGTIVNFAIIRAVRRTNATTGRIMLNPYSSGSIGNGLVIDPGKTTVQGVLEASAVVLNSSGIYRNTDSSQTLISGGITTSSGANIELYGGSHASLANRAYIDADYTTIRTQSGSNIGYFDSTGLRFYSGKYLYMNGNKVVGDRQSAISDPASTTAGNNAAIDSILAALRAHGLIAT